MTLRTVHLDAAGLKVLAHPLRARLLGALRVGGPATASGLGAQLGASSGLTSYHLRVLAGAGLVEDDDRPRHGRERWWRAAHDMTSWRPEDAGDDPDARAAEEWLTAHSASQHMAWLDDWIGRRPDAPAPWRSASEVDDHLLELSPAELGELLGELGAAIAGRAGRRRDAHHPDRAPVRVLLSAFPLGPGPHR